MLTPALQEDPHYSYSSAQPSLQHESAHNRVIFGDNLAVLHALLPEFTERVKCVYIDPPYTTTYSWTEPATDLGPTGWLDFMRPRLSLLRALLRDDGLLAVQIDDNEFARLYLLLAELFEERNLKVVCVKMAEPTGLKMASVLKYGGLPKLKEYIILAGKSGVRGLHLERVRKGGWDREYNLFVGQVSYGEVRRLKAIIAKPDRSPADVEQADAICARFRFEPMHSAYRRSAPSRIGQEDWRYRNAWRIVRTCATSPTAKRLADARRTNLDAACGAFTVETPQRKLYLIKADYNPASAQPRMRLLFADDYLSVHPGDFWSDIKTTGLGDEGGVDFLNGKKPEALLRRIIGMATSPGDWVLDAFGGSGTTGAVAHKMGRRWLLIENGPQCHSHLLPRLRRVIDGTDQTGVSKAVRWRGGGGFRYFRLNPDLEHD
ncbi:MAG: site-specific DNA-methyltransferase [Desulfurellaceae bacterium]|nr:site-specific DNA-methyltransferase [Desulfurellaceae bacterium]